MKAKQKCKGYENGCLCKSCVDKGYEAERIGDFFLGMENPELLKLHLERRKKQ